MPVKEMKIESVTPTVFLRRANGGLEQLVRIALRNDGVRQPPDASLFLDGVEHPLGEAPPGESVHELYLPESEKPREVRVELRAGGEIVERQAVAWRPPRRWVVHVVQYSHHDVGYTDLASHVLAEHDRWLDGLLDVAKATADFPEEARFRAVIEQAWSLDHYLKQAPPERAADMAGLLRAGDVELTALFGNLTTELCGHETLIRALEPAHRLAREIGAPLCSAEHNDIPGFAWGLSEVLAGAGIRLLCLGLPLYYGWAGPGLTSFWNEETIFGRAAGVPGAFWWESPSGKRLLVWCGNRGGGSVWRPDTPELAERLREFEAKGYPWPVVRWPVIGGGRDNSPYIGDYAQAILRWNAAWAYPRLISSTNARFYGDLLRVIPSALSSSNGPDLPVWRGGLPGQDYPVGALSTAAATAANRRNHARVPVAERAAVAAARLTDHVYPQERIHQAYRETLWHDEHTWGHHFPAGPTAVAAELEKAVHAFRADALAYDVLSKALARLADRIRLDAPGIHLVVFNPTPRIRTDTVRHPLREPDNGGSELVRRKAGDPPDGGWLRMVILTDRWRVSPPAEIVAGRFRLVEAETGQEVAFQIVPVDSPLAEVEHAAQRVGLAAGGRRYGSHEDPVGLARDLCFIARDVPPMGYRTYRLEPMNAVDRHSMAASKPAGVAKASGAALETGHYAIRLDPDTGFPSSIVDIGSDVELVDPRPPHPFGSVVVVFPDGTEEVARLVRIQPPERGALYSRVRAEYAATGHPRILATLAVWHGIKRIELSVHILKGPEPLLEAHLAFPFRLPEGRFTMEEVLAVTDPERDRLPGAFLNRLCPSDWVRISDGSTAVLWSSPDSPLVSLGRLWPSRVSPAHSCLLGGRCRDAPQKAGELRGGRLYATLFANNFGTNFAVSQAGAVLFRTVFTSLPRGGGADAGAAAEFGESARMPFHAIFTKHPGPRDLPPSRGLLRVGDRAVKLLALRAAADGATLLRLWNTSDAECETEIEWRLGTVGSVRVTDFAGERPARSATLSVAGGGEEEIPVRGGRFTLRMPPQAVVTARVEPVCRELVEPATADGRA